jgi:hypothetical protein
LTPIPEPASIGADEPLTLLQTFNPLALYMEKGRLYYPTVAPCHNDNVGQKAVATHSIVRLDVNSRTNIAN